MRNRGIVPDTSELERIFEPYFTTGTRGAGLGLAICRKIISLHDGRIEAFVKDGVFEIEIIFPEKRSL
jgi:signal transduction histidine kinase